MQILYVHQNFPAQFGHIAWHLTRKLGWKCWFVSQTPSGEAGGVEKIQYLRAGGATGQTHFCARTFENAVVSCDGVHAALKARPDVRPDLIVGHSGFGSTLFLRDLYPGVPVINLFEYYYRPGHPESDMGYRRDLGWRLPEQYFHRARCRNAMMLLDLDNCAAGYCPTEFQRSTFPEVYLPRLRVIFDGIERELYHGHGEALRPPIERRGPRQVAGVTVPASTRVVTYVSRGFESMRGFDLFMRSARIIAEKFPDVAFFIAGDDKIAYGGDEAFLPGGTTFKQWVLSREEYDLCRFHFLGNIAPTELASLLATSDLHIYLTVPFVLSWSMMDAMSCGAVVLGSDTPPVREMITDGENGLLADLFDVEGIANKAVQALRDPAAFRPLGRAAEQLIIERYGVEATLPLMVDLYENVAGKPPAALTSFRSPGRSPRMIRRRGIWVLLLLLWLAALVVAAGVDRQVAQWVRSSPPFSKHGWFVPLLKLPGNFVFTLCAAALLVFFHRRSWRAGVPLMISGPLVGAAYIVIKWAVGRKRPVIVAAPFDFHPFARGIMGLLGAEKGLSFPSGHAAIAFATATCLAAALPRWAVLFFLAAAAVAAERVLENAHYVSDVVAAAGLGVSSGWIALWLSARWLNEPPQRGFGVIVSETP